MNNKKEIGIYGQLATLDYHYNQYITMLDSLNEARNKLQASIDATIIAKHNLSAKELAILVKDRVAKLTILDKAIKICKEAKDL